MAQIDDITIPKTAAVGAQVFPIPGTNLYKVLHDPEHRRAFRAQLKRYNPWITALYRIGLLPLLGVSRTVMILTTRGQKSGKLRRTPIGYFRIGGVIYLFSAWGNKTGWYQNMLANPNEIWIQIGQRQWPVQAQTVVEADEILRTLGQFVSESPAQAHELFGWDPARDRMKDADFSQVIEKVLTIRFVERN